jgi:hypothetical protein
MLLGPLPATASRHGSAFPCGPGRLSGSADAAQQLAATDPAGVQRVGACLARRVVRE